jgi:K+-sensing histidine kinase KdpD
MNRVLTDRPRPLLAVAIGAALVVVDVALLAPPTRHETRAIPALALVLPIVITAVLGGRKPAFFIAAVATVAFDLALPPVGSLRLDLSEDVAALSVFVVVAVVVSSLVTAKISALQRVDEQRRALLHSVSNELRTPLTAISAIATDLRTDVIYDNATRDALLDVVIDEAARLDRLVANLLSMSRIEAGSLDTQLQPVDVADVIEACTKRLARLFIHWPLEIDMPERLPPVSANPGQLSQVLTNLLENAVRHTPPGTAIRVVVTADTSEVKIAVADNGPGIDPAVRAHLLEPVHVHERSKEGRFGLTVCQAIMQQHAGILYAGETPGGGATFTIALRRGV